LLQATWPDMWMPAPPRLGVSSCFCFLLGISCRISALRKEEGADKSWFKCDHRPECLVGEWGHLLSPMRFKNDAGYFQLLRFAAQLGVPEREEFEGAALSCRAAWLNALLRSRLGFLLDAALAQAAACCWVLLLSTLVAVLPLASSGFACIYYSSPDAAGFPWRIKAVGCSWRQRRLC
ncbi:unnamed protein product, partial [Bubo scandiacus]